MHHPRLLPIWVLTAWLLLTAAAAAQPTPYIGFVYPAGGQQGTTFAIRLGGQRLDGARAVLVSGSGVRAERVEYRRHLGNQEITLMREQLRELRQQARRRRQQARGPLDETSREIMARIEDRLDGWVNRPANPALAHLVFAEVTVAPHAEPGPREIRVVTATGVTNPMRFQISQLPESERQAMSTTRLPVLGNEQAAERNRPKAQVERRVRIPCVVNGQVAAGEVNHYRFEARQGQELVLAVQARELIPFIADAVPSWFQPVLTLFGPDGREVAYSDAFRFEPDSVIHYPVPADGEYVLTISDALFRGREDFVYRIQIGETPFLTSVFPLGGPAGEPLLIEMQGWNLRQATLNLPSMGEPPGVYHVTARRHGQVSNRLPFVLDDLPEVFEQEPNDDRDQAQPVELPVIINGRIAAPGDWDLFRFDGRRGEVVVAEVLARRLNSPLDSLLWLTGPDGSLLAMNDDHEDPAIGRNTHHADSYLRVELPADGTYTVHLGDTAGQGGPAYAYRLRLSPPRPDFQLRVVPAAVGLRSRRAAQVSVYAIRRDGFAGDIRVQLANPPRGFNSPTLTLAADDEMVRLPIRTNRVPTDLPVALTIEGRAQIAGRQVVRAAVPAEDRMQAFLWRHLVPAEQFHALVFDPSYEPTSPRNPPPLPEEVKQAAAKRLEGQPRFTQRQVAGRLRQLRYLYENWLLTDAFYHEKVAECEVALATD